MLLPSVQICSCDPNCGSPKNYDLGRVHRLLSHATDCKDLDTKVQVPNMGGVRTLYLEVAKQVTYATRRDYEAGSISFSKWNKKSRVEHKKVVRASLVNFNFLAKRPFGPIHI